MITIVVSLIDKSSSSWRHTCKAPCTDGIQQYGTNVWWVFIL